MRRVSGTDGLGTVLSAERGVLLREETLLLHGFACE